LATPDDAFVVGSVGRLVAVKGLDTAIQALAHLQGRRHSRPVHLLLVGDGPERGRLADLSRSLGVGDRVHLAGHRDDVGNWLAAMDVYVNGGISDGMSQSIVEAMAFELPLVVSHVGDSAVLAGGLERCGLIVPPSDAHAMTEAVEQLTTKGIQAVAGLTQYKQRIILASAVFAVSLSTRLGVFIFACQEPQRVLTDDSGSYNRPALNLLRHRTFSQLPPDERFGEPEGPVFYQAGGHDRLIATKGPYRYESRRTPFYPGYLAAVYGLFGFEPRAAVFIQCWLGALTCVLVFLIAVFLGGKRAGVWAGVLLAFDLGSLVYTNLIMTETWFALLITAGVLFLLAGVQQRRHAYVVFAGLLLGLAALCRPAALYLIPLVAGWAFVAMPGGWRRNTLCGATILVASGACLFPWFYRNYHHFGVWKLTSIQGLNLFYYKAAYVEAGGLVGKRELNAARQRMERKFLPTVQNRQLNYMEMEREYQRYAMARIGQQPVRYATLHALGTLQMGVSHNVSVLYQLCGGEYHPTGLMSTILTFGRDDKTPSALSAAQLRQVAIALAETVVTFFIYAFAAVGTWMRVRRRGQWPATSLLLLVTAYLFVLAGPQGLARLRIPAMPALCVLAGIGIDRVYRRGRKLSDTEKHTATVSPVSCKDSETHSSTMPSHYR